jgi:hypothetical protein
MIPARRPNLPVTGIAVASGYSAGCMASFGNNLRLATAGRDPPRIRWARHICLVDLDRTRLSGEFAKTPMLSRSHGASVQIETPPRKQSLLAETQVS